MTAFGAYFTQSLESYSMGPGLQTEFGTLLPPGGRLAAYVRATPSGDYDDQGVIQRTFSTLNAAAGQCRAGKADIIVVLPGHTENISSADQISNLKAGTQIIGAGFGSSRPTFTWTAAAASFLLDVADVRLHNLILNLDPGTGTTTVAAPMTISAPGCSITGCKIRMGTDANSKVTIGITTTAAADDLVIAGNEVHGATAAECTTMFQFVGADRLQFHKNMVVGATSNASVGVLRFLTTASLNVSFQGNYIRNNKAGGGAGDQAVTGMAGNSGIVDHTMMVVLGNNAANLTGAWGTPADVVFGPNVSVANTVAERAAAFGTVSA